MAISVSTNPIVKEPLDRGYFIVLCQGASVAQSEWRNRDTAGAQRQVGEALMLLRAGCDFRVLQKGDNQHLESDGKMWWLEISYKGFEYFEGGLLTTDYFYIPTAEWMDKHPDKDWY